MYTYRLLQPTSLAIRFFQNNYRYYQDAVNNFGVKGLNKSSGVHNLLNIHKTPEMVAKFCVFEITYVFLGSEAVAIIFSGKGIKNHRKSAGMREHWPTTLSVQQGAAPQEGGACRASEGGQVGAGPPEEGTYKGLRTLERGCMGRRPRVYLAHPCNSTPLRLDTLACES